LITNTTITIINTHHNN